MIQEEFIQRCDDVQSYWGHMLPMMSMEEAGELIQAISKYERKRKDVFPDAAKQDLIDEIGDMYICLMALQIRYTPEIANLDERIEKRIEKKLRKHY